MKVLSILAALFLGISVFFSCQNQPLSKPIGPILKTEGRFFFYENGIQYQTQDNTWLFREYSFYYNPSNLPDVSELHMQKSPGGEDFLVRVGGGEDGSDSWTQIR